MTDLVCKSPETLQGKLLIEVGDDELTCDPKKLTTSTSTTEKYTTQSTRFNDVARVSTTAEPEIIWSLPPSKPPLKIKTKSPQMKQAPISNDDTLIIGIVGGVVAFIAILIIIICIVRLRMSSNTNHGHPYRGPIMQGLHPMPPMGPGSVQMSYKGGPPTAIYAVPPYAQSYATLPHKMSPTTISHQHLANTAQIRPAYSTMGRLSYNYQQQQQLAAALAQQQQSQHSPGQNSQMPGGQGQPYVIYPDDKTYR